MKDRPWRRVVLLLAAIALGLWAITSHLASSSSPRGTDEEGDGSDDAVSPIARGRETLVALDPGRPRRLVRGTVTGPTGLPLAGAKVRLAGREDETDERGAFELPRALGELHVDFPGHFPALRRVGGPLPADSGEELTVVLLPGNRIEGRVLDPDGSPIEAVDVILEREEGGRTTRCRSTAGGRWRSPLLRPGRTRVLLRHPRFQVADRVIQNLVPGRSVRCDVRLRPGKPLSIRVEDTSGRALADARVWLELDPLPGETRGVETRYLGRTGDLGRLRVGRDGRRSAWVRVRLAGYREERVRVRVRGEEVRVRLPAAPTLQARAVDAQTGLPVTPRSVRLELLENGAYREVAPRGVLFHSLSGGKIRVGLPPLAGTWRLRVTAEGDRQGVSEPVRFDAVESPPETLVRLERHLLLRGVVLGGDGPVEGASVEAVEASVAGAAGEAGERGAARLHGIPVPPLPFAIAQTTTDRAGRFVFGDLSRPRVRLLVRHPGHADQLTGEIPFPPPQGEELPIQLEAGARIEGRVERAGGQPAPDVPVVAIPSRGLPREAWTDPEGRFRFERLPAGSCRVEVGREDEGDAPPDAASGESAGADSNGAIATSAVLDLAAGAASSVTLHARPPTRGEIEGRITMDGVGGAWELRLEPPGAGHPPRRLRCSRDGSFHALCLAPGRWRLRGSGVPVVREVEVRAGERARVEVDVKSIRYDVALVSATSGAALTGPGEVELRRVSASLEAGPQGGLGAPRAVPAVAPARQRVTVRGGAASFERLFPGVYELRASAPGRVPIRERITLAASRRDTFGLEPGRAVQLELRTRQGAGYEGEAEVTVRKDGETIIQRHQRVRGGLLDLPPLGLGSYSVEVHGAEHTFRQAFRIQTPETPKPPRPTLRHDPSLPAPRPR